jgi:integrase
MDFGMRKPKLHLGSEAGSKKCWIDTQVYDLMNTLKDHKGVSARALRFLILTACRTSEVTGARWDEIDLDKKVWSIPADRMKSKRPHRVALSDDAIEILEQQAGQDDVFVFLGIRDGSPISTAAMPKLIKELRPNVTCHGMRSSFRTWAAERTSFPREIAETALAHTNGDRVESAYLHSDHLEKRFLLMSEWAKYCATKPTKATVTSLTSKTKK